MFAGADTIIGLIIFFAIAAVSSWLKKRQQDGQDAGPTPPSQPRSKPANWEEALRRLLEEGPTAPPPPPAPVPPPPPAVRPPTIPRTAQDTEEMERGLAVELPTLTQSAQSYQRASHLEQQVEQFMQRKAALSASAAAYQRASQLDVNVSAHLRRLVEQAPVSLLGQRGRSNSPEWAQALALLRQHDSLRSALLVSVILGPPKALEG